MKRGRIARNEKSSFPAIVVGLLHDVRLSLPARDTSMAREADGLGPGLAAAVTAVALHGALLGLLPTAIMSMVCVRLPSDKVLPWSFFGGRGLECTSPSWV